MKSSQFLKNLSCKALFVGLVFATVFVVRARADDTPVGAPSGTGANLTFIIEENNSTEKGETPVPIVNGQPKLKIGQVIIPGDARDSLRIQVDSEEKPTMYFLGVTSDNDTDMGPAEQEMYVATNSAGRTVTYIIKSDAETPEPGSLILFGTGLLAVAGYLKRRLT